MGLNTSNPSPPPNRRVDHKQIFPRYRLLMPCGIHVTDSPEEEAERAKNALKADELAEEARKEMMALDVSGEATGASGKPARRQSALAGMGVFEGVRGLVLRTYQEHAGKGIMYRGSSFLAPCLAK